MAVTIAEVARRAGTSTATVSHVVNSTGQITKETRRRVLAAIKELRYYPNLHARNLALHRSRTLGMVVSDIENPFFPTVIRYGMPIKSASLNLTPARSSRSSSSVSMPAATRLP